MTNWSSTQVALQKFITLGFPKSQHNKMYNGMYKMNKVQEFLLWYQCHIFHNDEIKEACSIQP